MLHALANRRNRHKILETNADLVWCEEQCELIAGGLLDQLTDGTIGLKSSDLSKRSSIGRLVSWPGQVSEALAETVFVIRRIDPSCTRRRVQHMEWLKPFGGFQTNPTILISASLKLVTNNRRGTQRDAEAALSANSNGRLCKVLEKELP